MADPKENQYVGGPFDGGTADGFLDRIDMRGPMGIGSYVRGRDEDTGITVFRWEPQEDTAARSPRA